MPRMSVRTCFSGAAQCALSEPNHGTYAVMDIGEWRIPTGLEQKANVGRTTISSTARFGLSRQYDLVRTLSWYVAGEHWSLCHPF